MGKDRHHTIAMISIFDDPLVDKQPEHHPPNKINHTDNVTLITCGATPEAPHFRNARIDAARGFLKGQRTCPVFLLPGVVHNSIAGRTKLHSWVRPSAAVGLMWWLVASAQSYLNRISPTTKSVSRNEGVLKRRWVRESERWSPSAKLKRRR
uniref:Uncharacterized protein n=1 Tax=Grammatophora oceanica TaxID=210454 RepID=A0A6U5PDT9_9STRA|mmetsp:Transcript_51721/g.77182  ORF Transcript_51721/g.77182 Transcript_51721/m.77182 type:complete len:152 (+) Transcript_51721:38-493(+)